MLLICEAMVHIRLRVLYQHSQVTIGIIISITCIFFGQDLLYSVIREMIQPVATYSMIII